MNRAFMNRVKPYRLAPGQTRTGMAGFAPLQSRGQISISGTVRGGVVVELVALYVFSARTALPLPVRNERGEGRGEGKPTADTPAFLPAEKPRSEEHTF